MQNLKIKVNSEAESKEAQELFFELGFQWRGLKSPFDLFYPTSMDNYYIVLTKGSKEMQIAGAFRDGLGAWKEITLSELRAMVNQDQDEPFLTPETTLNDQYAEIEQVRQAIKVKSGSDSDHALDAMSFGLMGLSADANHAQQQTIEATLAERQSTYGNFEDVAFVTENIMSILAQVRVNGLNELPHTHRMALYMIASKMARIVNGDFNHLDSWHDIGGYSKLIEKLINGE